MTRDAAVRVLLGLSILFAARAGAQASLPNEDGYDLWLRYRQVASPALLAEYRSAITHVVVDGNSPTLRVARDELVTGLSGLLGRAVPVRNSAADGALIVGT